MDVPQPLIDAVLSGDCVAFVGAGFSAGAVPTWQGLLQAVAKHASLDAATRTQTLALLSSNEALSLEAAAETLRHGLGEAGFRAAVAGLVAAPRPSAAQQARVSWLRGIPFRAILTTNFDGLLPGHLPSPSVYRALLRAPKSGWFQSQYWLGGSGPPVVKLHGDASADPNSVVLTRRDYRRRLYDSGSYMSFLRAVFATRTVLFLGCSFNDFYINELRSEVLSLLGQRTNDAPLSYALVCDQPAARIDFFRRHEGIEVMHYDSVTSPPHRAFDRFIENLYSSTNALLHLGRLVAGRRILWHDPNPHHNVRGKQMLQRAVRLSGDDHELVEAYDVDGALAAIEGAATDKPFDLLITHWGHTGAASRAEQLLAAMRGCPVWTPSVVFASSSHAAENKRRALRAGAIAYCHGWPALFKRLGEVFDGNPQ